MRGTIPPAGMKKRGVTSGLHRVPGDAMEESSLSTNLLVGFAEASSFTGEAAHFASLSCALELWAKAMDAVTPNSS